MCVCVCVYFCVCVLSCVQFFATSWTVACQAPLFVGLSRQEYWSGLPFTTLGDLRGPEIRPVSPSSPALAGGFFLLLIYLGSLHCFISINKFISAFLGLTDSINLQSLNCSINQFHHLTGLSWIKLKNIWHVVLLYLYESRKCCNLTCGWYCIMIWRVLCRAEFSWKPRAADLRYRRATLLSEVLCHWSWILM